MEVKIQTTTGRSTFPYEPTELSAFACTYDVFVISLKGGAIVRHIPEDADAFHDWLIEHGIRNINRKER